MDNARSERIRELIETLESIQKKVHGLKMDEDAEFENSSRASRETGAAQISDDATFDLEEANDHIQSAIEHMQSAVDSASE